MPVPHATRTSSWFSISSKVLLGHTSNSLETRHLKNASENYFLVYTTFCAVFRNGNQFNWKKTVRKTLSNNHSNTMFSLQPLTTENALIFSRQTEVGTQEIKWFWWNVKEVRKITAKIRYYPVDGNTTVKDESIMPFVFERFIYIETVPYWSVITFYVSALCLVHRWIERKLKSKAIVVKVKKILFLPCIVNEENCL